MNNTWGKYGADKNYSNNIKNVFSNKDFYKSSHFSKDSITQIITNADKICHHTFDFLGTGLTSWGKEINWSKDVISSYTWKRKFYFDYTISETLLIDNVDIKIPWELNRLQHLVVLGQAWRLSNDEKYILEIFNQLEHWQKNNPFCYGINWLSTMEVSIRAINIMITMDLISNSPLYKSKIKNITNLIEKHGKYIQNNIEIGIIDNEIAAGNHLLANFSALAMIGMIYDQINDSKRWLKAGIKGLYFSIDFMVLEDGFFFESSTSYHRFALELFLFPYIISKKINFEFENFYVSKLEKMFELIYFSLDFDGTIPIIGDNDDGRLLILSDYFNWKRDDFKYLMGIGAYIFNRNDFKEKSSLSQDELIWIFDKYKDFDKINPEKFMRESKAFQDSGLYLILDDKNKSYALTKFHNTFKKSPMAHSHYDMLSIALTHFDQKIFIDAGSFCYTLNSKKRNLYRGSFYHNIVTLNNSEIHPLSSDVFNMSWSGVKVELIKWDVTNDNINLVGQHNGYYKNYGCYVKRSINYTKKDCSWKIIDEVIGDNRKVKEVNSHWLLSDNIIPKYSETKQDGSIIYIDQKSGVKFKFKNHQNISIEKHTFSPSYGIEKNTLMIRTNIPVNNKIIASLVIW